ncbi:ATP-grasp domain-containing protein [Geminocystis sp. NIES-3709]|uniref:ATP-grasp domain-containing protein n=1 Tax=Geminocystis sp. NIES-3709 TaxID=1617448 RepID=UPI0005FCA82D|nr:ATP-grasp domain-containing protein [Geminocystis sp. NIES-3709]BAQ65660.1 ATP-grasp enzyme-like protein [Geminocystis sp. NIES-3709]
MITVLVTGIGAIIGQGIIKSLRCSRYPVRIVGVDRSDRSPGPYLCDVFLRKPFCNESNPDYLSFWKSILETEKIDLIIPGLGVDIIFLLQNRQLFEKFTVPIVLNNPDLITLSLDKWLLGEKLQQNGFSRIPSAIMPSSWKCAIKLLGSPPLLLKPCQGEGSRGIVRLYDETDFLYWQKKTVGRWMLQKIVGSDEDEYTVGVFGLGDGKSLDPIIFRRKLSGAGNTLEAEVIHDELIEKNTFLLTKLFQPLGATNYQFRKEGEIAYLLEINPRFSSSNSLRTAFGYNEAEMSIDYFLFGKQPIATNLRQGIAWRFSEDFVIYDRNSV